MKNISCTKKIYYSFLFIFLLNLSSLQAMDEDYKEKQHPIKNSSSSQSSEIVSDPSDEENESQKTSGSFSDAEECEDRERNSSSSKADEDQLNSADERGTSPIIPSPLKLYIPYKPNKEERESEEKYEQYPLHQLEKLERNFLEKKEVAWELYKRGGRKDVKLLKKAARKNHKQALVEILLHIEKFFSKAEDYESKWRLNELYLFGKYRKKAKELYYEASNLCYCLHTPRIRYALGYAQQKIADLSQKKGERGEKFRTKTYHDAITYYEQAEKQEYDKEQDISIAQLAHNTRVSLQKSIVINKLLPLYEHWPTIIQDEEINASRGPISVTIKWDREISEGLKAIKNAKQENTDNYNYWLDHGGFAW